MTDKSRRAEQAFETARYVVVAARNKKHLLPVTINVTAFNLGGSRH